MTSASFATDLARFGPTGSMRASVSMAEARDYCRQLARRHYENFIVGSLLLPRSLRSHFFAIYAYCRWADDLADESASPQQSLELLDWWEAQLDACYAGNATHPVFVALAETIREFEIERQPFADLLVAFRRDQQPHGYATYAELLDYCRYSANPVGRLVLHLGRGADAKRVPLSDKICTALQLANFWQDVARDAERGRNYLPQDLCAEFGYTLEQYSQRSATPEFQKLLAELCKRAETLFDEGQPLVELAPAVLKADIWLFIEGGRRTLAEIRKLNYDVWRQRPKVSRSAQLALLGRCVWRNWRSARQGEAA